MIIITDTREKKNDWLLADFQRMKVDIIKTKLDTGDYANADHLNSSDPKIIVDRKSSLTEMATDLGQQFERFKKEWLRARENNILLVVLIEHEEYECLEDILDWENPILALHPNAMKGSTLYKKMRTISDYYGDCIRFEFCKRKDFAKRIVELLE